MSGSQKQSFNGTFVIEESASVFFFFFLYSNSLATSEKACAGFPLHSVIAMLSLFI